MVRVPNKLYTIQESTIWQMCEICQQIPSYGVSVKELYRQFADWPLDDFMDALTGLYAIQEIKFDNQKIKRHVTGDTL